MKFSEEKLRKANEIIARYPQGKQKSALIPLLHIAQEENNGWLSVEAMDYVAGLLQIKPIITVDDGVVNTIARVRTISRAKDELVRLAHEQAPLDRLALLHTNYLEGVEWMREQLADILPAETLVINVTTAIGTHVGPQCLGFVTVNKNWRN